MQNWRNRLVLLVGLAVAAGACGRAEHMVAPGGTQYDEDPVLAPDDGSQEPQDNPPADSTSERWGGFLGGGGG